MKIEKLEIGRTMYFVEEHLYYVQGFSGPVMEYCVCDGDVTGFFQKWYTSVDLRGRNSEGFPTPYRYVLSDIGEKLFYTKKEAAQLAKELTEKYERVWGWLGEPQIPLRRPWAHLLHDDDKEEC